METIAEMRAAGLLMTKAGQIFLEAADAMESGDEEKHRKLQSEMPLVLAGLFAISEKMLNK